MQIQRFNSTIWSLSSGAEYDIQPRDGYNLSIAQSQWNNKLLNPPLFESYARAIDSKGSTLPNCFGFIDGTVRPICWSEKNQRIVHNGRKRVHGLKYQSVVLQVCWLILVYFTIWSSMPSPQQENQ